MEDVHITTFGFIGKTIVGFCCFILIDIFLKYWFGFNVLKL
jgi:hypothetical protein